MPRQPLPSKKKKSNFIAAAVVLVFLITAVVLILTHQAQNRRSEAAVKEGREYLAQLDSVQPSSVEAVIKQHQLDKIALQRQAVLNQISGMVSQAAASVQEDSSASSDTDSLSLWSYFKDYALLGDSRASGFSYYGYLSEDRCFADLGLTIENIPDYADQLAALNPSYVMFSFGANGVKNMIGGDAAGYAEEYHQKLAQLQNTLPNARFFVVSILPTLPSTYTDTPNFQNIDAYNTALKAMCDANGYVFIDCTDIANQHQDLYEGDGIHVAAAFYPYWGADMLLGIYQDPTVLSAIADQQMNEESSTTP